LTFLYDGRITSTELAHSGLSYTIVPSQSSLYAAFEDETVKRICDDEGCRLSPSLYWPRNIMFDETGRYINRKGLYAQEDDDGMHIYIGSQNGAQLTLAPKTYEPSPELDQFLQGFARKE